MYIYIYIYIYIYHLSANFVAKVLNELKLLL